MARWIWLVLPLLACERALDLPPKQVAPTVSGIERNELMYWQTVEISGRGFDAAAADHNRVTFPWGEVPACWVSADGTKLRVHPPQWNGATEWSGPLSVVTSSGRSDPSGTVYYEGDGHPLNGQPHATVSVLHQPEAIVANAGDVFLPSALFRQLLGTTGIRTPLPAKPHAMVMEADGTLDVGFADSGVMRVDPKTGAVKSKVKMNGLFIRDLRVAPADALVLSAVGTDRDEGVVLQLFRGEDLVPDPAVMLPLSDVSQSAPSADGSSLVITGADRATGRRGVLVVNLQQAQANPVWLEDETVAGPLVRIDAGRFAVAHRDGTIRILALAPQPAFAQATIATPTPTSPGALAWDADDGLLFATKPTDHEVQSVALATNTPGFRVRLDGTAIRLAWDAVARTLAVPYDDRNEVEIIAPDGTLRSRRSFAVGLGNAPEFAGAPPPDYDPVYSISAHNHLLFLARSMKAVIPLDTYTLAIDTPIALADDATAGAPVGLARDLRLQRTVTRANNALAADATPEPVPPIWVLHENGIGHLANGGGKETVLVSSLAAPPTRVAFAQDGRMLVGSAEAINVYKPGEHAAATLEANGGSALPKGAHLEELTVREDGTVLVAWTTTANGEPAAQAALYTIDALTANGTPLATWQQPTTLHGFFGLVDLRFGAQLFYNWCDTLSSPGRCAIGLGLGSLKASDLEGTVVKEPGPVGISPDRDYFLTYRRVLDDGVIHLIHETPDSDGTDCSASDTPGMSEFENWHVPTPFATPAFEPAGTWLFVPQPTTDSFTILD